MPLTLVITLPRTSLVPPVQSLVRTLTPLAAPLLGMAIDASGLGLPARLLLHAALHASQQLRHTNGEESTPASLTIAATPLAGSATRTAA
ncbi:MULTISPECIES: hypothetical protein [Streptomyces]|uniref:hypothetical protein n=1 Tax=Streptomyces TaxID=1883 RepID=UPI00167638E8|nr:hypothetical protein [Streptomyces canarius]